MESILYIPSPSPRDNTLSGQGRAECGSGTDLDDVEITDLKIQLVIK